MLDGSRRPKPKILVLNNENSSWREADLACARIMLTALLAGLDVNANPDLDVTSVLPIAAQVLGLSDGQELDPVLSFAAERWPAAPAAPAAARINL